MSFLQGLGAVATASADGRIDWAAVETAATAATPPGALRVAQPERSAVADDVAAAAGRIAETTALAVSPPETVTLQHRHHWIGTTVETLEPALRPLADRPTALPVLTSRANTAAMGGALAVLSRHVLGQYDPPLFRDGPPRLLLVWPNVERAADRLSVDPDRFRRWIIFHEVAHAAEFQAAPWLADRIETAATEAVADLAAGSLDREALGAVDETMTVVEGYAEFLMDRAFDGPIGELRAALDARRRSGGPLAWLVRRLLGLHAKRRQYERGRAFFEAVAAERGVDATAAVWSEPGALPTDPELDSPRRWIDRVDP